MTLKNIEDVKREIRKALGRPDAAYRIFDNNKKFRVQLEKTKEIGGAAKVLVWNDYLEKDIEQQ